MTDQMNLVDPDPISLTFECLKAEQPIGDVFLAKIPYKELVRITYFDVRRVLQDDRDVERYLGIQRPLITSRVAGLQKYVNFFDASFPTAIIIAIDERFAEYDEDTRIITLSNVARGGSTPEIPIRNLARVLDGQHRIAGLRGFEGEKFDLPVTIFVGADIADQAHIFATVNLEQQKVNKSLAYDLYSLAKSRSPQKTCHNVAVVLDQDEKSPFFKRIKRLGVATDGRNFEPISQATFVESLMRYVSADPKGDRDRLLRGERLERPDHTELQKLPFRDLFILEKDLKIVEAVFDYFSAVKERWPLAWSNQDRGNMLNRTNGFRAFMRAYIHVYDLVGRSDGTIQRAEVDRFMENVPLKDDQFNTEEFPPGTSGESKLVNLLRDVRL